MCEWSCWTCDDDDDDDDKRVIKICVHSDNASGSLELCYVPPKAEAFIITSLTGSRLTGSVNLTQISNEMNQINPQSNNFTGQIDLLKRLPNSVCDLYLNNNQFSGEIDLT